MTLLACIVLLAVVLTALRFTGFPAQRLSDYAGSGPRFDPKTHLSGPILCEGVIYGPMGRVTSRFVADMHGSWEGTRGSLKEHFRYDSGSTQNREWNLTLAPDGTLQATADDLIGPGQGQTAGPACQMRYRIRLAPTAGGHELDVIDWMYLMPNGTIMNRSQFFKWGFKVAELIATMRPTTAQDAKAPPETLLPDTRQDTRQDTQAAA